MLESEMSEDFLRRLSHRVSVVLALAMVPGLGASFMRAQSSDGAYAIVFLQLVLFAWVVVLALPLQRIGFRFRAFSLVAIGSIFALAALARKSDPGTGMAFLIVSTVFLSIVPNSYSRYLYIAIAFPGAALVSHYLGNTPWQHALSHTISFSALGLVLMLLVRGLVSSSQASLTSERKLRLERDRALQQLQIEEQRRMAVSENANVAFFQFDYASGRCYGDATELARHGLSPDAEFWDVAKGVHLFAPESQELIQSQIAELSQKPASATAQFVLQMPVQPSDELRSFRISGLNVEVDGKVQFAGASIDITNEVSALEKAKDLSSTIELVSGAGGVGLIELFPDTRTFKCNPEVSKRLAVEHTESERDIELFYAHQTEEIRALFLTQRQALEGSPDGKLQAFVHPFYFANGDLHYMRVSRIKREVNGRISFLGLSLDITDEVQAKERAEKQAEQLNLLAMSGEVAYFEVDLERGLIDGNALLKQRAGLPADAPAFPMAEIVSSIPVEARAEFEANVQRAIEAGLGGVTTFEHPCYKHDGELIYVRVTATTQMLHGRLHALGASVEITEAVRARQQAEKQAEQLKLITEQGKIGPYEFDLEKGVIYANSVLCERYGVDPEVGVITQQQLMERTTEGAREAVLAQIEAGKTQTEGYFSTSTIEEASGDGKVRKIRIFEKIERREGRPFYVGASVDVTEEVEAKEHAEQQAEELRKANEEIRFRTENLENMLEAAPIPVCLLEGDSKSRNFTFVNKETLRVLGYTKEEMLGANATEMMFLNDEDRQYYMSKVLESIKSGIPLREEMQLYRKNKVVGNFEFNCTYKMVGEKLYGTLFVLDIDERKQKEQLLQDALRESLEKERLLKLSYSVMDLAVGELDLETNLVRLVAGDTPYKALLDQGVDFWEFFGTVYGSENAHKIRKLFDQPGESLVLPALVTGVQDHWAKVGCTAEYSRDGRRYRSIYRLIVDELVEARHEAETQQLALRESVDRQAQMYAVIGHELRTPAASLQMMLDDLGEGESLDSALARANIEQLLSVIDTLRAVAQPERVAQATYDDVQIDEMLQQQVQNFQTLATRHGIQLKTDFTGLTFHPVHIQKTLLRQVLSNLIKNALIHSGGTELEVGASGRMLRGERKALRLWIADNGKGVSADKVEKLFEAFVRGSTEAEGTGLGLHICREIVQNMGGDLRYEPRPEGGACFVIELDVDLAKSDPSEQLKPEANESPLKGTRVLVAEDNKTIQMLTQKMLEKQGAQVTVANNGKEALEVFEPGKFDLMLSDIFMPEMNGYEFAREVRLVDTAVPLIGLTAATIGKETDEMLAAGASTVLSKPISLSKLLDKLAEIELAQNPA